MFKIGAVTSRKLCKRDFLEQIAFIMSSEPSFLILREKDLSDAEYQVLAKQVLKICEDGNVLGILHSHINVARELKVDALHLPLPELRQNPTARQEFKILGASIHSMEEAREAESLGATYLTAGHIFQTDCKKGLPPRGISFLHEVVEAVSIPVFGIGGIHESNLSKVMSSGAVGACMMSDFMTLEK